MLKEALLWTTEILPRFIDPALLLPWYCDVLVYDTIVSINPTCIHPMRATVKNYKGYLIHVSQLICLRFMLMMGRRSGG